MKEYEKKIKWTLILFLGLFVLLINIMTFWFIRSSLEKTNIELSKKHMEHQYQNFQQRVAILEQQLSLISSDAQLISGLQDNDLDAISKKLQSFQQSSQDLSSLSVFSLNGEELHYLLSEGRLQQKIQDIEALISANDEATQNTVWYLLQGKTPCFIYVYPLIENNHDAPIGCLVAEIGIDQFMDKLSDQIEYTHWNEYYSIALDGAMWSDYPDYWDSQNLSECIDAQNYQINSKTVYISRELTSSGQYLLQSIVLKTGSFYRKIAFGLFVVSLLSILGEYFAITKTIGNIMGKLQELKEKMTKIEMST